MCYLVTSRSSDKNRYLTIVILLLPLVIALHPKTLTNTTHDFIMTKSLGSGEISRVFNYLGICGRETIINWGETSVALRELVLENGRRLQLIYEGDNLTECVDVIDVRSISEDICGADDQDERYKWIIRGARVPSALHWLRNQDAILDRCNDVITKAVRPKQLVHRSSRREKRDVLIVPGTKWCGRGNHATKYTNLGGFGKADACCRKHDTACRFWIPALGSRYGLINWRISTLMHCSCDERFRTCLKMAATSSANFVGKIFFNMVQTKCFVFKPQKVCTRHSWWGKCEKYKYKKQAFLRDNVPY